MCITDILCCTPETKTISKYSCMSAMSLQSCSTLCDPMDCSLPGFPVLYYHPEFAQTHVHWVGDAIESSHPLSSPSPPAFNLSQHQDFSQWISSPLQVAKVLKLQLQHQFFQWVFRVNFLQDWLVWSTCCPRDSKKSPPAWHFESISPSELSLLYWQLENHIFAYPNLCQQNDKVPLPFLNPSC